VARGRAIAAAQTVPKRGDVEANVEEHLRIARAAAEAGARTVVFPELSLTGYELDLASTLAFDENDPRLKPLVDAAISSSTTLVVGAPARIGRKLHIGAFILSGTGSVAIYTKHHLGAFSPNDGVYGIVPPPEGTVFDPGEQNPLIPLGDDIGAVAVCADTGRPSHPERAASRGATTYLASMFVIPSALEGDTENFRRYAERHSLAIAFANYGGPTGGLPAAGRSAIWSERGALLAELDPSGAGFVVGIEDDAGWSARALRLS
jgi:predicted amidohydrolase